MSLGVALVLTSVGYTTGRKATLMFGRWAFLAVVLDIGRDKANTEEGDQYIRSVYHDMQIQMRSRCEYALI